MLKLNSKICKIFQTVGLAVFMLCSGNAVAQEITAIDFNGDLIGKVIPDGKVVSFDNQLIGNITADSLIVDFNGKNATMEDRIRQVCSTIDNLINEEEYENENLINEAVSALSIDNNDAEVDDVDLE